MSRVRDHLGNNDGKNLQVRGRGTDTGRGRGSRDHPYDPTPTVNPNIVGACR